MFHWLYLLVQAVLLGGVVYFLLKVWLTASTLHNEKKLFVPSVRRVLPTLWRHLDSHPQAKRQLLGTKKQFDSFIDLGAGYGSVVVQAYQLALARKATGIELQWLLHLLGKVNLTVARVWAIIRFKSGGKSVLQWKRGDFLNTALNSYDCFYIFLAPSNMPRLLRKLKQEAQPGAVILSWVFPIPEWKSNEILRLEMKGIKAQKTLYVYKLSD